MARDRARRARDRHSCTRTFLQCLPFSLPPSSAASPPSRRPRSKCVFFRARARRADARRGAEASRDARERGAGADAYRISRARAWARVGARGRADGRAGGEKRASGNVSRRSRARRARRARVGGWIRARGGCADTIRFSGRSFRGRPTDRLDDRETDDYDFSLDRRPSLSPRPSRLTSTRNSVPTRAVANPRSSRSAMKRTPSAK